MGSDITELELEEVSYLKEADLQKNAGEPEPFENGKSLAAFLKATFSITEAEGEVLLGCLKEQALFLGQKDGDLYRKEKIQEQGEVRWMSWDIEDVINSACEYNYEMILQLTQDLMDTKDMRVCEQISKRLNRVCADEVLLDNLFDRTKYGKEIEELAHMLAKEFIQDMESKDGIDGAIEKMKEAISAGKDLLPDVSSALKQSTGRSL